MYVDFVTEYMFTTQSPEEPSLFFTGQASEETRAVARESRGPILESAGHIAIATAGITFMGMTAFAMPFLPMLILQAYIQSGVTIWIILVRHLG